MLVKFRCPSELIADRGRRSCSLDPFALLLAHGAAAANDYASGVLALGEDCPEATRLGGWGMGDGDWAQRSDDGRA